jgi:deoxycytidine triphosphate deaminase
MCRTIMKRTIVDINFVNRFKKTQLRQCVLLCNERRAKINLYIGESFHRLIFLHIETNATWPKSVLFEISPDTI